MENVERLSLNQITMDRHSLPAAVEACARAGIPYIGVWRHKLAEAGLDRSARLIRDAGLQVSSLCRGGFFAAGTPGERRARIEDNLRAVDEAAALGTDVLVLVCGPADGCDLQSAREYVAEGIAAVLPYARKHGVKLAIEPLHPMFCADRSVIVTLGQALDLAQRFDPAWVGVAVDVYHVWWDPAVYRDIESARGRIFGFHVDDWIVPLPDMVRGRGMMGDGVIELRRLRQAVDAAGYTGPIEVEIMNEALWAMDGDALLGLMRQRYLAHV